MTTSTPTRPALLPRLADGTGGVVVCLATGPSLTQADVDACRGKATVIAVNNAHELAPWADVLYSSDRYWFNYHRGVPAFSGRRATIEYSPGRRATELLKFDQEMAFYRHTGHQGVETDPDGLRTCACNSGGAAVNLALHLGARRIALLGYDMGATQGKRHFFGDHPPGLSNTHNYPSWRRAFDTMRTDFDRLGVSVLNCTRTTSLTAFACGPLEEALS